MALAGVLAAVAAGGGSGAAEREALCEAVRARTGATVVPPYDHAWTIAGQGTIALEMLQDVPEIDTIVAPVGGGGMIAGCAVAACGLKPGLKVIGVEAAGQGLDSGKHAASLSAGSPGVLHGNRTYLLQNDDGQITEAHSISAGLDYPGIGPEHAWLHAQGRVNYVSVTDQEALAAFQRCAQLEGILPALEPSHALAHVLRKAGTMAKDKIIVMNMCGRGDKDIFAVAKHLGRDL